MEKITNYILFILVFSATCVAQSPMDYEVYMGGGEISDPSVDSYDYDYSLEYEVLQEHSNYMEEMYQESVDDITDYYQDSDTYYEYMAEEIDPCDFQAVLEQEHGPPPHTTWEMNCSTDMLCRCLDHLNGEGVTCPAKVAQQLWASAGTVVTVWWKDPSDHPDFRRRAFFSLGGCRLTMAVSETLDGDITVEFITQGSEQGPDGGHVDHPREGILLGPNGECLGPDDSLPDTADGQTVNESCADCHGEDSGGGLANGGNMGQYFPPSQVQNTVSNWLAGHAQNCS